MVSLDLADEIHLMALGEDDREDASVEVLDAVRWCGAPGPTPDEAIAVVPSGPSNLVSKALALVGRRAAVSLVKHIPAGAGLGGGSSDAAAILRWAGNDDLLSAASLGADVPFCVHGGRALVRGIGEVLEPLEFEETGFVVCTPPLAVATSLVYQAFDELGAREATGPNDLEAAAICVAPELAWWRALVADATASVPVLAGSGASWFVECTAARAELAAGALVEAVAAEGRRAVVEACRAVAAY